MRAPIVAAAAALVLSLFAGDAQAYGDRSTNRIVSELRANLSRCVGVASSQQGSCIGAALRETETSRRPDYQTVTRVYRTAAAEIDQIVSRAVVAGRRAAAASVPAAQAAAAAQAATECSPEPNGICVPEFATAPQSEVAQVERAVAAVLDRAEKELLQATGRARVHHERLAQPLAEAKQLLLA